MSDKLKKWQEISAQQVFSTKVFELIQRQVKSPDDDEEFTVWNLHSNDFCNIVPLVKITDAQRSKGEFLAADYGILLIEQYRFGNQQYTIEIPGGMIEDQEQPLVAAARELREETGYVAERLTVFSTLAPNPAIMDNTAHLIIAYDCKKVAPTQFDELEDIVCTVVPVNQIRPMIMSGSIRHSIVVATLMMALQALGW